MIRSHVKLTADDYRTLPEFGPRYQLVDGELRRISPAPAYRHQRAIARLLALLVPHVEGARLGSVVGAPIDVYLSEHDVVQPDVLFIAAANEHRIAEDGVHGPPDLVVEVLSPSTRHLDLGAKKRLYARHGVTEMWTIDLDRGSVSVYSLDRNAGEPESTLSAGSTLTSALLPGLSIDVAALLSPR